MRPPRLHRPSLFYGWAIVAVGILVAFSSGPGQSFTFAVFIDSMIEDTGLSRSTLSGIYTLSTGLSALMVALISRRADRLGPRRLLVIVTLAFAGACFGLSVAAGIGAFLVCFAALRGLGQASLPINATLLVNQWFVRRRGRAIAIMGLGFPLSNAVLPPVSQVLVDGIGWRSTFAILGAMVLILVLPATLLFVRNTPESVGLHPDGASTPPASELGRPQAEGPDRRRVLTSPSFWALALPMATPGLVITALVFHQFSIFEERGLSAGVSAASFSVFAVGSITVSMLSGWIIDRAGPYRVAIAGMSALLVVLLLAQVIDSIGLAIAYALATGTAAGTTRIVSGTVWAHRYGRQGLGRVQGSAMMVGVSGAALGPLPLALMRDATGTYSAGIAVLMVLPVLAIVALIRVSRASAASPAAVAS
ncbi:MAG TPA: MFS transporter [Dehalococcoidia bacterium]|nr:MFS transporter [Dehalococcoidia bacterium]